MARKKTLKRKKLSKLPILSITFLIVFGLLFKNYQIFIYPQNHRDQPSVKKIIENKVSLNSQNPKVLEHGSRNKRKIALTFDADMTPQMLQTLKSRVVKSWYNQEIKKTLDLEHATATVFFTGLWVKAYPKEARQLAKDPLIEIGNHSFSHPAFRSNCYKLPVISDELDAQEVNQAQRAIFEITGITPKYFRFPGGCYENSDLQIISKLDLKIVQWDVVSGDAFNKDAESIIQNVESQVQNGSIIVFHLNDGPYAPKTNDALVKIIPDLKKRGFEFVKISELEVE